jgi:outer membrane receptor for ferrienterochelin and colicins
MAFREEVNILNAKLFYEDKNGWFFNVRGIYRGEYGFAIQTATELSIINPKWHQVISYSTLR